MSILSFYILPTNICIFTKTTCGYCTKAVQLLQQYDVEYQLIELDKINYGSTITIELKNMTRRTTVPNIFIYGKHIGGYSELLALHNSGELKNILQLNKKTQIHYVCETCGKSSATNQLTCNCFQHQFSDWGAPF
tara:strand:- start:1680 stop:2084 length:405 start_codon:yes stop_codon:yes gene_type:complete